MYTQLYKKIVFQPFKSRMFAAIRRFFDDLSNWYRIWISKEKTSVMTMKMIDKLIKSTFMLVLLTAVSPLVNAQKFAYVDSDYILSQIPEYRSAQKQIDELAEKWQKEIDNQYAAIDKMYKDYRAEKVLLNGEQQKEREAEIIAKENEVRKFQQDKFGYEGALFKKREELIKPIQDRVFEAIQQVAKENSLDFMFDKSGEMIMLFTNARYDRSDEVLEELGITPMKENKQGDSDLSPGGNDLPPGGNNLPPR